MSVHTGEIKACYDETFAKNKNLAGKLTMAWEVLPDGNVKTAEVIRGGSTLDDADLENCHITKSKTWTFPKTEHKVRIEYPIIFEANECHIYGV
ncbi:MAG: AgmX/PglI C-terminal domain-containing protein [Proteobacteria bacterium]|nr:AgmX/PglI C-terminal domain-containing protein [Pseudomonadota bacterium]